MPTTGFVAYYQARDLQVASAHEESGRSPLSTFHERVIRTMEQFPSLDFLVFASIVLVYSKEDVPTDFYGMVASATTLYADLLESDISVQGAISFGNFETESKDMHGRIVAGPPIIDAFHYSTRLAWMGVILTPTLLKSFPPQSEDTSRWPEAQDHFPTAPWQFLVRSAEVNLHNEARKFGTFALLPVYPETDTTASAKDQINRATSKLMRLRITAPDPEHQRSYSASAAWLGELGFGSAAAP